MIKRNIVVVGGSQGIGKSIVENLILQGHHVTVFSRNRLNLVDSDQLRHISLDILQQEIEISSLPEKIDGLVYCPGSIVLKPFKSISETQFLEDFNINVLGAVKSIKTCLNGLKKSENNPSIVLFSTVAVQQGMPFHASIATAKGGVEGLTRSLAAELSPNIRVNAIAPSLTQTPLAEKLLSTPEKIEAAGQRHPLKSIGQAEDMAKLAIFLLTEGGRWMTGQILHLDGGMSSVRV